jgi:tetratricopeptide (TPR) repeat protein
MWHRKFMTGMFDDAYQISKELYDNMSNICCLFDLNDDIAGRIYSAHGLSLKMNKGGTAALHLFKEGIENYPESYNARAAYLSQEGNCLLKEKPLEAIKKYSKLLDTVKGKAYPFMEIIHTRIDIAMSNFLAQEYDTAKIWAEEGLSIASALGIHAERGRALNILGCCKAANGEFNEGLNFLKEGDFYLDLSGDAIYRWRTMLNQASLLLQIGDNKNAKALIIQVLDILLSGFASKIKSDNKSVPYQSLLLILMYLHELKEDVENILVQFESISIRDDFNQLCKTINWKNCFQNKVKYCNSLVLVTG